MLPVIVSAHKDPAPSRIRYRLQRLWLRPAVRSFWLRGLPILALAVGAAHLIADEQVRQKIQDRILLLREAVAERPELTITGLAVTGASDALEAEIRHAVGFSLPASSLDIDIAKVRAAIVKLDAVRTARVRLQVGGRMEIRVEERIPVVVWRQAGQVQALDFTGARVALLEKRSDRPALPLIIGEGAERHVDEATGIFKTAGALMGRIRALVRVGERRWDVVLDRGQIIRLPETGARAALERVLALDAADELLERDVQVVDMRDGRRPVLRLSPVSLEELRRLRRLNDGEDV